MCVYARTYTHTRAHTHTHTFSDTANNINYNNYVDWRWYRNGGCCCGWFDCTCGLPNPWTTEEEEGGKKLLYPPISNCYVYSRSCNVDIVVSWLPVHTYLLNLLGLL